MPLPEFVAQQTNKLLTAYCDKRVPVHVRDKIKMIHKTRGNNVTLFETRPVWNDASAEWTENPVARFDFDPSDGSWTLKCFDRNSRAHIYDLVEPTKRFEDLLEALEKDKTGIFWG